MPRFRPERLLILSFLSLPGSAMAQEVSVNGFGDFNYGRRFGKPADAQAAETFEAFGEDVQPKSSHSGFGVAGTDFVVTAELPSDLVYLGEINFQVERGQKSEFEVDVERMLVEKRFWQAFNLQGGLFFTPIGYFNRTLYSRAYLMTSAQVPDLFEEELGLVPTHTIGLQVHGGIPLRGEHRIEYAVSLGNGRAADPVNNVYARDDDGWRSATAMLEWWAPWAKELRLGVSGWTDRIQSYRVRQIGEVRDTQDPSTELMKLSEVGLGMHFVLKSRWLNLMADGMYQRHHDQLGNLTASEELTTLLGAIAEASFNLGPEGAIKPYARYDLTVLPQDAGPYLGLRSDGDEVTRTYVPEASTLIGGVAWDAALSWRLKLEYSAAFAGPRERHCVLAQSAFAF